MTCFEQTPGCIKIEPSTPIPDPTVPSKADRSAVVKAALHHRLESIVSPSNCEYGDTGMPKFDAVRSRDLAGDASPARIAPGTYGDEGMPNDSVRNRMRFSMAAGFEDVFAMVIEGSRSHTHSEGPSSN